MSDFYTKKQRKFWCESCKIFIEYTKLVIDQHNKSKNHLRMINADANYKQMKGNIARHNLYNYGVQNESTQNTQQNFLRNKTERSNEFGYASGYGRSQPTSNGKKIFNILVEVGQSMGSSILEEFKRDQIKQMVRERHKAQAPPKVWGLFTDPQSGLPFYYNYITKVSQWEKPADFDGIVEETQVEAVGGVVKKEEPTIVNRNPKEGTIGKCEVVEKSESIFEKNKAKQTDHMPGVIGYDTYVKKEYGSDYYPYQDYEEDDHDERVDEIIRAKKDKLKRQNKKTIDNYISENDDISDEKEEEGKHPIQIEFSKERELEEEEATAEFDLNKENIIDINKKLMKKDYDLKYVSQTYALNELKHFEEEEIPKAEKVAISFNAVKKNTKKISSIFKDQEESD